MNDLFRGVIPVKDSNYMIATGFVQKHEAKGQEPVFFSLPTYIVANPWETKKWTHFFVAVGKLTRNVR